MYAEEVQVTEAPAQQSIRESRFFKRGTKNSLTNKNVEIVTNKSNSSVFRKLEFPDDDTLTLNQAASVSVSVQTTPDIKDIVKEFRAFLKTVENGANSPSSPSSIVLGKRESGTKKISPLRPLKGVNNNNNIIDFQKKSLQPLQPPKQTALPQNGGFFGQSRDTDFDDEKIELTPKQKKTKSFDTTVNDINLEKLIKNNRLLDFSDIEEETNDNDKIVQNVLQPELPPKRERKPLQPIDKSSRFKNNSNNNNNNNGNSNNNNNIINNDINRSINNSNNSSLTILPKKEPKKTNNNNNTTFENSINTVFIAQNIQKLPKLVLSDEDDESDEILSGGNKQNVNRNNSNNNYINDYKNKKNNNNFNDEDDECITKADIDPVFESEHSAILPPKSKNNNPIDKIIALNNSMCSQIPDFARVLFVNQFSALFSDVQKKTSNYSQLERSITSRLKPNAFASFADDGAQMNAMVSLYIELSLNELFTNILSLHKSRQLLMHQVENSARTLQMTIEEAGEELRRPKCTMNDVSAAIAKLEASKKKKAGEDFSKRYVLLRSILPFKVSKLNTHGGYNFNNNESTQTVNVRCSYRGCENEFKLANAEFLHVKVSNLQRVRKLKEEIANLMSVVPDFFFDGTRFSCVISSERRVLRFAVVLNVPSHYPWCCLSLESVRIDFAPESCQNIRSEVEEIVKSMPITAEPLTMLVGRLLQEFQ